MPAPRPKPELRLSLQFARCAEPRAHRALLTRPKVARCVARALESDAEITVRIVGADEGRELNRSYRNKDYATNVLSFCYARQPPLLLLVSADLVLCAPVIEAEARAQNKSLDAHYAHMLVHATLHAQGWEHETGAAAARAMEARETQILHTLGFADPYAQ